MKIGIFGGSFNPIHVGHIALAQQLRELAGLDEVWLTVSPQNPLKLSSELLDDQLRFQLVRLALHNVEGIRACSYELRLPKPSYTWNTLQHLTEDFPGYTFTLLIGGDNWQLFPRWYRANDIVSHYSIVVYPRRGSHIDRTTLPASVHVAETELLDISSTAIRERLQQHQDIAGMVPKAIEPLVRRLYIYK
ncbi:MAG: nicotinate-nucleotide adenylyltransferase [Prevotella sp.]|nr:nicotinate-nucleotide adenylyltransferase [Prevotella sp.]